MERIVIVGGVAAGASAAAKARRTNEAVEISVIEKGPHISFANCGLPYYLGGVITKRDALLVYEPERFQARFNVRLYLNTRARSVDPRTKQIAVTGPGGEKSLPYDRLILATGAKPSLPPIPGLENVSHFSVRTVPDVDAIKAHLETGRPRKALIIGGGYIGVELAEALIHCGLQTTVVEAQRNILPALPPEMSLALHRAMVRAGIEVLTRTRVTAVEEDQRGVCLHLHDGRQLAADMLFVSTGVEPDTDLAATAGVGLGPLGGVATDDRMQTSVADIYAAGDMVEKTHRITGRKVLLPLAGPANREGRVAGCNAAGGQLRFPGVLGTAIVGFGETCAARTGLSLQEAEAAGFEAECIYTENAHHAEYFPGARPIYLKLTYQKGTGRLLGAAACGHAGVARRIDVLATALAGGLRVQDLEDLELCYAPPYGSAKDNVNMAGFVASNQLRGTGFGILPQAFLNRPRNGLTLLDVRTPAEYASRRLEGAVHIPLEELRNRLDELDRRQPVYIYCAVGYRGYLAARILRHHGLEAYNILGGIVSILRLQKTGA